MFDLSIFSLLFSGLVDKRKKKMFELTQTIFILYGIFLFLFIGGEGVEGGGDGMGVSTTNPQNFFQNFCWSI